MKTYWLEGKLEMDDGPIDVHKKTRNPSTVNLHNFSMEDFLGTGQSSVQSTPDQPADKAHVATSHKAEESKSAVTVGGHSFQRFTTPEKSWTNRCRAVSSRRAEGSSHGITVNGEGDEAVEPEIFEREATGINILRQFGSRQSRVSKVDEATVLH